MFLDGLSLLGLSNISVSTSVGINDTALTNATVSRMEMPDPIDNLDLTVCPADDVLDGCKVNGVYSFNVFDIFVVKINDVPAMLSFLSLLCVLLHSCIYAASR